ncbi:hypothetical protein LTR17_025685 [Elasticomyces elasticus]|nr:hypothetical protein LTR17_025685 [Elasticomyces elasticus]
MTLRKQQDLPSWCPDYSVSAFNAALGDILLFGYDALRSRKKYCSIEMHTRTLTLEGLFLEKISAVHPSLLGGLTAESLVAICLKLPFTYRTNGQDRTEAMWRTVIADRLSGMSPAPDITASHFKGWLQYIIAADIFGYSFEPSLERKEDWSEWSCLDEVHGSSSAASLIIPSIAELSSFVERFRELLVAGESSLPELRQLQASHDVFALGLIMAGERPYFTTATGLLGLTPPSSHEGDQVWFFSGAKLPFVLRPEADGIHYTLVGEAYVHGYMRVEILDVTAESDFKKSYRIYAFNAHCCRDIHQRILRKPAGLFRTWRDLKKLLETLRNLPQTEPDRFERLRYKIQKRGYPEESRVKNFFSYDGPDAFTRKPLEGCADSWAQCPQSFWQGSTPTMQDDVSPVRLVELYINAQCNDA